MKLLRAQTGYTLIELLLYIAMIGMLLSAVAIFFGASADSRVKNQTVSEVDSQGTYLMDYISQTIRNASSISAPSIGTSSSSLTLTVPTASLSPTIFSLSSGALQVKEGTAAAVSLTSDDIQVTAFTVKNLSRSGTPGIVQISLTLNRVNSTGRTEYDYARTFTTSAGIRP